MNWKLLIPGVKVMYRILRFFFFCFDPEVVHRLAIFTFRFFSSPILFLLGRLKKDERYRVSSSNLSWDFPIGLAAGLDKNGHAHSYFSRVGFGAVELGTVTVKAQKGNKRPRVFRYISAEGLRNYMGFPNRGMDKLLARMLKYEKNCCLGINIGKNSDANEEQILKDYCRLYDTFSAKCDYLVINISCPNVEGNRSLQEEGHLREILKALESNRAKQQCPLFVKISPDLSFEQLDQIIAVAEEFKLAGIVATNTLPMPDLGPGGISGRPLYQQARLVRNYLLDKVKGKNLEIIGVGGFFDFDHVLEFFQKGGRFIQIYTSFIYHGPVLLRRFQKALDQLLVRENCQCLEEYLKKIVR